GADIERLDVMQELFTFLYHRLASLVTIKLIITGSGTVWPTVLISNDKKDTLACTNVSFITY
ncbi:MAG: hypothetical protein LKG24_07205, partial [Lacticaseibacillus songhuajiangensis]|nr:hypothetical protein [Lacticaseibacillus songhuajiangensis]